ncbi:hypothetical protein ACFX2A_020577 [Malus domestica]
MMALMIVMMIMIEDGDDDDDVDPKLQKQGKKQISEDNSSKTPGHLKPANFYVQNPPSQDPVKPFIHDAFGKKITHELAQWGGFNKNSVNAATTSTSTSALQWKNPMSTTSAISTSAMESKPPLPVKRPMLPSASISSSDSHKKIN